MATSRLKLLLFIFAAALVPTMCFHLSWQGTDTVEMDFSEPVEQVGGGAIIVSNFAITMKGGVATLASVQLSTLTATRYQLQLQLNGQPDGVEELTVSVKANQIQTTAGVVQQGSQVIQVPGVGYPNSAVLIRDKLYIVWLLRKDLGTVSCKMVLHSLGWCGIAFESQQMVGSTAIIGVPGTGVHRYDLTSQQPSGVTLASAQDLTATSVTQLNGDTIVKWNMTIPAVNTSTLPVTFAYGSSNSLQQEVDNGATTLDLTAQPGCDAATSCQGHGSCNGTRCVCDVGYTDIDCGFCASGFARGAGATDCTADFADATVVVAGGSGRLGENGSPIRDKFVAEFEADVAAAVVAPRQLVMVTSVQPLSGAVRYQLTSTAAYRRMANNASAVPGYNLSAVELGSRMRAAFADGTSALWTGTMSRYINQAEGLQISYGTQLPPPVSGDWQVLELVPGMLTLEWVTDGTTLTVEATLQAIGWLSVGFNGRASMVGTDAVIGRPQSLSVQEYWLKGKDMPKIILQDFQDLSAASIGQRDGVTRLRFTRALDPGSKERVPIPVDDNIAVVYAWGLDNAFAYHGLTNVGTRYVNFVAGTNEVPGLAFLQVLHAVVMSVAFFVLIPLGIFTAMFGRFKQPTRGRRAWWYQRHLLFQYSAIVCVVVGVVASYNMVHGNHLANVHAWMGAGLALVVVMMPSLHCFRKRTPELRMTMRRIHRIVGRIISLASIPTVILGVLQLKIDLGWLVLYGTWMVLMLALGYWLSGKCTPDYQDGGNAGQAKAKPGITKRISQIGMRLTSKDIKRLRQEAKAKREADAIQLTQMSPQDTLNPLNELGNAK